MKIKMIVEPTITGYSAYADSYAIYTTGKDLKRLKQNMLEAIQLYFEDLVTSFTESDLDIVILNEG